MKIFFKLFLVLVVALVCGCTSTHNLPLIFGQSHTVGITISASTTDQGGEFTLGYKDKDIAVVPVTIRQENGNSTLIKSTVGESQDAMSVLGQFQVTSSTISNNVGLGKFFATGLAAQKLADGFKKRLQGNLSQSNGN